MACHEVFVSREVVSEEGSQAFDVVSPVAMEFAGEAEPGHELCSARLHAGPGGVAGGFVEGAGGVGDDEDFVAFFEGGEGGKGDADFGDDAGEDELLFAGGFDGFDEVFIVPGVDVAGAGDVGRIGKEGLDLGHERTVGAVFETGGEDRRQFEILGGVGEGHDVVAEFFGREVADEIAEARLVIDEQDGGVVFVEAAVGEVVGHCRVPLRSGEEAFAFASTPRW